MTPPRELTRTGAPAEQLVASESSPYTTPEQMRHFLVEASAILSASLDYATTLNTLAHLVVPDLADWCIIDMVQDDGAISTVAVAHTDPARERLGWELVQRFPVDRDAPVGTAQVIRTGEPEVIEQYPPDFFELAAQNAEHRRLLHAFGLRSSICVPLTAHHRTIGTLALVSAESGRQYAAADLPLIQDLAWRAALAVDNARLHRETALQARRAQTLAEVAQTFAEASLDLPALLERSVRRVAELIGDFCAIRLVSADKQWLECVAAYHIDPAAQPLVEAVLHGRARVDEGFMGRVIQTGAAVRVPVVEPEAAQTGITPDLHRFLSQFVLYSVLMVPLRVHGRIIGAIGVTRQTPNRSYTADDQVFLQDLADRAALAIDHARLYATEQQARLQAEQAAGRLGRLQAVTAALAEALTAQQVAEVVVAHGLAAVGAAAGCVALLNSDETMLDVVSDVGYMPDVVAPWRHLPLNSPMPLTDAARTGQPIYLPTSEARVQRYPHLAAFHSRTTTAAWVALPLNVEERTLGALGLNFDQPHAFDADEQAFMLTLAHQCAQALDRARLYEAERGARAAAEAAVGVRETFLSIASHELKTPITALLGHVDLLLRRNERAPSLSERDQHTLQVIRDQVLRLNRMIGTLLDISRLQHGQLSIEHVPFDICALAARIVADVQPSLRAHTVVYAADAPELIVVGDELRLEQVLQNLLQNAIKYSPDGGPIFVQLACEAAQVRITVTDRGIGIPQTALPHLFQRFFRAANADTQQIGGMGIGLYVVREVIELHGGTISVTSTEGQGSTFTITLPLYTYAHCPPPISVAGQ